MGVFSPFVDVHACAYMWPPSTNFLLPMDDRRLSREGDEVC